MALLVAGTSLLPAASALAGSLRFFGTGAGDVDRVKIRIDDPAVPADVGASDFTLEWWMRALPGENASADVGCDVNDGWITGNILFDRDVFFDGDHGDYGVSLTSGRVAFGVAAGSAGNTICGETDVADGVWHHVAVTRQLSTGRLRIYVDGVLDAEGPGGVGASQDVSYRDGRATSFPGSDPFLVIGAEKHDAGPAYPSYHGWIDEVRLSTVPRYTGTAFTRPFGLLAADGGTAALYHFDEGSGDAVGDASGGGSHGVRQLGGDPAGPQWSSDAAPLEAARRIALEPVVMGLTRPVGFAHAGDARLFIVEAGGQVLVHDGTATSTFLDIAPLVRCCGEEGLLGLAFHPGFAANGYFFVYYTDNDGDIVLARYRRSTVDPAVADPNTGLIVLTIPHPTNNNHNGGALAFGPDGYLYVAVGDGGGGGDPPNNAQSLDTLLGKILRLDVSVAADPPAPYAIPPTNPFVESPEDDPGTLGEIWAYGLRNPWRIAFDRVTGDLFVADVGQGQREEVNLQPATGAAGEHGGRNYGWRRMEGTACYNPSSGCQTGSLVLPILEYTHAEGCSVTGGYRYRGTAVPSLHGVYVFADFCTGEMWGGVQAGDGAWSRVDLLDATFNISSFGEDAAGELYVAAIGGTVYRIVRVLPRLTVSRAGSGTGSVSSDLPGISCGTACAAEYEPGTVVTLTALAGAASTVGGWSGDCGGGAGTCLVTLDADRAVTATFHALAVLQFSAASYTVSEGSSSATITVRRTASTAGTVTVDVTLAPGTASLNQDYRLPASSRLTFGPGITSRSLSIPIVPDSLAELFETVQLGLVDPTGGAVLGGQSSAVLTINDNDPGGTLQFGASTYSVGEGQAGLSVSVKRADGSAGGVSVDVVAIGGTAAGGVDYALPGPPVTLQFAPGQKTRTFSLAVLHDTDAEPDETIVLELRNARFASIGSRSRTTVRLVDDDRLGTFQLSPSAYTVSEAAAARVVTVTRSGATPAASVSLVFPGGSATGGACGAGGADYTPVPQAVAFAAGQGSRSVSVPICPDALLEGPESFPVRLDSPSAGFVLGSVPEALVTISDDESAIQFSATQHAVSEGADKAALTLQRIGSRAGSVTVRYRAVAAGAGAGFATPAASASSCSPGADFRPVVGTVTFASGESTKGAKVPLCRDASPEGGETLTVVLEIVSGPALPGAPASATVLIQDDD